MYVYLSCAPCTSNLRHRVIFKWNLAGLHLEWSFSKKSCHATSTCVIHRMHFFNWSFLLLWKKLVSESSSCTVTLFPSQNLSKYDKEDILAADKDLPRCKDLPRRCLWCNGYRRRKWTRRNEFKSWTKLIASHIALMPLGKVWIQLFSLQL